MPKFNRIPRRFVTTGLFLLLGVSASLRLIFPFEVNAQIRPVYDQGALGLGQLLKRLNTTASAMMIGAHPDDEDTALLAYLARGENARTAYLSLTRGDGGQNILGSELGESLGVIRTEELLQARKLDGAEQYFTRAYDYGFSKTLEEAKQKWDEKTILCDVVRVIRNFRPLVVISQFSGTPADGHGQHQYSGYISPLAVKAAADMSQCTDDGPTWNVKKFYVRHRGSGEPTLRINTGKYDPLLGRSYFEIAMEARSQHKSQEQGVLELKGEQYSSLNLVGNDAKETGIFDGAGTSITGVAANTGNSEAPNGQKLAELKDISSAALGEYDVRSPAKILPHLVKGYTLAVLGERSTSVPGTRMFFAEKQREFSAAIKLASGIQIDVLVERETVVPGETFSASVKTFFAVKDGIRVKEAKVVTPAKWTVSSGQASKENTQGFFRREAGDHATYFTIDVPSDAMPTQPYWLVEPRDSDLFRWSNDDGHRGLPLHPALASAEVTMDILGTEIVFKQPVEYRFADDVRGEVRRNLNVVPAVSIDLNERLLIVPESSRLQKRRLQLSLTSNSNKAISGRISLNMDSKNNWIYRSTVSSFEFNKKGETKPVLFDVTVPSNAAPGIYPVGVTLSLNGETFSNQSNTLSYPHIRTHRTYGKALARFSVIDFVVPTTRVGYIAGSGDAVPEAIKQMGMSLFFIDEKDLAAGDFSMYDVVVVGIRASEVRPDFMANNDSLLNWVRNGGTLVVQYQRPVYVQQGLTPYPAQMGPRVADENAKVTILQPNHPILSFPNKITDEDFKGWVQERNLYNFSTFDERYLPLLESHDAGEPENKGSLVIADVGKGKYIYCSYSLFRQLPAGVPGAYRLLANMLSLPKVKNKKP